MEETVRPEGWVSSREHQELPTGRERRPNSRVVLRSVRVEVSLVERYNLKRKRNASVFRRREDADRTT